MPNPLIGQLMSLGIYGRVLFALRKRLLRQAEARTPWVEVDCFRANRGDRTEYIRCRHCGVIAEVGLLAGQIDFRTTHEECCR